jgi:hypothetical protein
LQHHSDKEKFCSDLNRPKSCKMSESVLKTLQKFEDFQAEYKGATPSGRSSVFSTLTRAPDCIPINPAASFLLAVADYFAAGPVKVSSITGHADYALIRSGRLSSGRSGDPHRTD